MRAWELHARPEFAALTQVSRPSAPLGAHDVREHRTGLKSIRHPVVGDLNLTFQSMDLATDRGLQMLVLIAYEVHNKRSGLVVGDVLDPKFQKFLKAFERGVPLQ